MSEKRKGPGAGDETEPLPFPVPSYTPGPLERAVTAAITAALDAKRLGDQDRGMAQLAVAASRSIDMAHRDPYAVAQLVRELREVLTRLKLDPTAREEKSGDDPFNKLLEQFAAGDPAAVRDPAHPGAS